MFYLDDLSCHLVKLAFSIKVQKFCYFSLFRKKCYIIYFFPIYFSFSHSCFINLMWKKTLEISQTIYFCRTNHMKISRTKIPLLYWKLFISYKESKIFILWSETLISKDSMKDRLDKKISVCSPIIKKKFDKIIWNKKDI